MSQLASIERGLARLINVSYEGSDTLPVTLTEAKLYGRIDTDDDDTIVSILIGESVEAFQAYTGVRLFYQTVTAKFQSDGYAIAVLPAVPVVSITSVQKDGEDVDYDLKGDRIWFDESGEIEVVYQAGLFETQVPDSEKTGFLKWIVSNYNDREDTTAMGVQKMPNSSKMIWSRHKRYYL